MLTLYILDPDFAPSFPPILDMYHNQLSVIELYHRIDENLQMQITLKCPQLTTLSVFEDHYSWSVNTLRSIVT